MQTRTTDQEKKELICTLAAELPAFEKAKIVVRLVEAICYDDWELGHRLALDVHKRALGAQVTRKVRELWRDVADRSVHLRV